MGLLGLVPVIVPAPALHTPQQALWQAGQLREVLALNCKESMGAMGLLGGGAEKALNS